MMISIVQRRPSVDVHRRLMHVPTERLNKGNGPWGTADASDRFLWDFRRTIYDLFADNYFGYFGELCHRNGLKYQQSVSPAKHLAPARSSVTAGSASFESLSVSLRVPGWAHEYAREDVA